MGQPILDIRWEENHVYEGNTGNWVDILNGEDGTGSNTLMDDEGFVDCKGYGITYAGTDETLSLSGIPFVAGQNITLTKTANSTGEGSKAVRFTKLKAKTIQDLCVFFVSSCLSGYFSVYYCFNS